MRFLAAVPLALGLALLAGCDQNTRPKEDVVYKGQPMSAWVAQVKGGDAFSRQEALKAFEEIGPGDEDIVPNLADAMQDESWEVRLLAAQALGRIGPKAKEAVPALNAALGKEFNKNVLRAINSALKAIGF
jgi:HEAT repeat protein